MDLIVVLVFAGHIPSAFQTSPETIHSEVWEICWTTLGSWNTSMYGNLRRPPGARTKSCWGSRNGLADDKSWLPSGNLLHSY